MTELPAVRTCGTMEVHRALLLSDPGYRDARARSENVAWAAARRAPVERTGITLIPVVVHVVYNTDAQNISDAQIQSQIEALNRDYRKANADAANAPAVFLPLGSDGRIQFALATTDPAGNPTSGITRTHTATTSFKDDNKVKAAATGGADPWPSDGYLNLWVCQLGGGLLGYAQFPGGPAATDGVVILHTGFGTTGTAAAPFNLGRTATHEIGHWLNLHHIWGDDGTGCSGSDLVDDTPNQAGPNYGTPAFPHVSCSNGPNGDMFMNYMDYVNDAAMFMFTQGQVARMQAALDSDRASIGSQLVQQSWHQADLTAAAGAPAAASDPVGYVFDGQGTQHVNYLSADGHVLELWWDTNGWHVEDLTVATGALAAAGRPAGYVFVNQGKQHVNYRGTDGHVHDLWWDTSGWHADDLTVATGAPAAGGEPAGYVFDAQGTQHVHYLGTDGHIHELWWDTSGWHTADLTTATGAPAAAGNPSGYVFDAQGTQHVHYRGADGHVLELWWDTNGWHSADLTAATGSVPAVGDPAGYVFIAQGTQHVHYRGTDGHIHELWSDANGWHAADLSAATGATAAAGRPRGYVFSTQGSQHVHYRGTDGHVHELWSDANGWHAADLSAATGATAAAGQPRGYMLDAQGTQHVNYRGTDGHIHELWWG